MESTYWVSIFSFKLVTEEAADSWGFGSLLANSFSSISLSLAAVSTGLAPPNIEAVPTELGGSSDLGALGSTVLGLSISFGRSWGIVVVLSPAKQNKC